MSGYEWRSGDARREADAAARVAAAKARAAREAPESPAPVALVPDAPRPVKPRCDGCGYVVEKCDCDSAEMAAVLQKAGLVP